MTAPEAGSVEWLQWLWNVPPEKGTAAWWDWWRKTRGACVCPQEDEPQYVITVNVPPGWNRPLGR